MYTKTQSDKINNKLILSPQKFLKNQNVSKIKYAQKKLLRMFLKKKIPYRSFEIKKEMKKL